jgi:phosphatidylinositol dimannoside acyltransferase
MKLQDLINGKLGIGIALLISRLAPPVLAYPLANQIADLVSRTKKSSLVQAIRANHLILGGESLSERELEQRTRATLRNTGRNLYDFYHYLHNNQKVLDMVDFDPSFMHWFACEQSKKQPLIFVAPHLSNFDLMMRAIILRGGQYHVLSYPDPNAGYRWQNQLRELPGLKITPMSIQALRQASETLRANGAVITGVDRPLPNPDAKYRPRFFGRPASLPVFHIRLALKHDLPIIVITGYRKPDGRSLIVASDPIPMQRHPDLQEETIINAEAVLSVLENYIRQAPEQWAMFYPVWPEALAKVRAA